MRGWHLSATDLEENTDTEDDSIIIEICEYFDGQVGRICGRPIEAGTSRCPEHQKPEFNQPMEMVKNFKELDPGRAFHLVKNLKVEIPKNNLPCRPSTIYGKTNNKKQLACAKTAMHGIKVEMVLEKLKKAIL